MVIEKTKEELKAEVLKYISLHTKSADPLHFLKKDHIISEMLRLFVTNKDELQDILDDLESEDKIKMTEVNYELYYSKSEYERFKEKLKKEEISSSIIINQNTIILISLIILGLIIYFLYKPSTDFSTIEEANKKGVYAGIAFSFFAIMIIKGIYLDLITRIEERRRLFTKTNLINILIIVFCLIGVIGFIFEIQLLWQISGLIIAVLGAIKIKL